MKFVITFVLVFLAGLVLSLPLAMLTGWALMIAIGIVHAQVLPAVIPAGYWVSVALAWLLGAVFGGSKVETKS